MFIDWNCCSGERYGPWASSQITVFRVPNVDVLLAVLLAQHWQMTLARCHFAHRADVIANGWYGVGPTPLAQQPCIPTIPFQVLLWANVGPTWFKVTCFFKNPLEKHCFSRLRVDINSYLPQQPRHSVCIYSNESLLYIFLNSPELNIWEHARFT